MKASRAVVPRTRALPAFGSVWILRCAQMRFGNILMAALLTTLCAVGCLGQEDTKATYRKLKEYEGSYQYVNNSGIQLAASPRDGVLYAIIEEVKYPLKAMGNDVFLDGTNTRVVFERDEARRVTGYRLGDGASGRFFRRLAEAVFPEKMWYPRLVTRGRKYEYTYSVPAKLGDGLPVGSIRSSGLDPVAVKQMVEKIVDGAHREVHSILILKDGMLVLEEYFYDYDPSRLHQLRSVTKSFISALIGIAIDRGLIKGRRERILPFFPEYSVKNLSAEKQEITIEDLLTHRSGLDCDDEDSNSPGNEQKMGVSDDWVKFTLDLPMAAKSGRGARYCSGGVIVLGRIIEKVSGGSINDFASRHLFKPLGISNFTWRFKPDSSSADTFGQLRLTPRDAAKFGLLYLNGGRYRGRQVISAAWVRDSLSKHSVVNDTDYGYLWWRQWLDVGGVRVDGVAAKGNGGQRIYLWPHLNMVAVITGGSYNVQSHSDQLLRQYILPSFVR